MECTSSLGEGSRLRGRLGSGVLLLLGGLRGRPSLLLLGKMDDGLEREMAQGGGGRGGASTLLEFR